MVPELSITQCDGGSKTDCCPGVCTGPLYTDLLRACCIYAHTFAYIKKGQIVSTCGVWRGIVQLTLTKTMWRAVFVCVCELDE